MEPVAGISLHLRQAEIGHFDISEFAEGIIAGRDPAGDDDLRLPVFFAEIMQGLNGFSALFAFLGHLVQPVKKDDRPALCEQIFNEGLRIGEITDIELLGDEIEDIRLSCVPLPQGHKDGEFVEFICGNGLLHEIFQESRFARPRFAEDIKAVTPVFDDDV